jgi:type II secretory pathway component PulJ
MQRRGHSLLEVLVAITGGTVILGILVCALQLLFRNEQLTRLRAADSASADRLAEVFRDDVHAAADVKLADGSGEAQSARRSCQLVFAGGGSVSYRAEPGCVVRAQSPANDATAGESFRLPAMMAARFEIHREGNSTLVNLAVGPAPPSSQAAPGAASRIEALLGRDLRFQAPKKSSSQP